MMKDVDGLSIHVDILTIMVFDQFFIYFSFQSSLRYWDMNNIWFGSLNMYISLDIVTPHFIISKLVLISNISGLIQNQKIGIISSNIQIK